MDDAPHLILIRPKRQSLRLLRDCEAVIGAEIPVLLSPLIKIVPVEAKFNLSHYSRVIVTSENGVRNAGRIRGISLYCVGKRTERAAKKAGAKVIFTARTSRELQERLTAEKPNGPLLHLRGKHVAESMEIAGLETNSVIVYDQFAEPVNVALNAIVCGDKPSVLPLYSPRSALLLGKGVEALGQHLHVIAISDEVAQVWNQETGGQCEVCDAPDGAEMIKRIVAALRG